MPGTSVVGTLAVNVVANTRGLNAGIAQVRGQFRALNSAGPRLRSTLNGISTSLLGVGAGAVAAGLGLRKMIGSAMNFNRAMAQSTAIMSGVNTQTRAEMEKTAKQVAFSTKFSSSEAAKSYFFLASAGLDAQQSIAALPTVATFAQAGMFDMALATDLLTDAQSALGLTVDDTQKNMLNMRRVGNVLVKANTLANASVQQFSEALTTKAGAAMKAFGVDTEDGVAALAALADQGIKGTMAGTQFSIVLRDLTTKAIENRRAFEQAKIAVFDETGALRSMANVMGDLERRLQGLSTESQKKVLLDLGFSDKSLGSLLALLGTSDRIRAYRKELKAAGDVMDEVANKNLTDFDKAAQRLSAALSNMSDKLFTPVLDAFGKSVIFVTDALTVQASSLTKTTVKVTAFAGAFLVAVKVLPKVINLGKQLFGALKLIARGQAVVLSLSGPAGWATVAAGAAAAVLAVGAVDAAFKGLAVNVQEAQRIANEANEAASNAAAGKADPAKEAAERAREFQRKQIAAFKRLRDEGKRVAESLRTPFEVAKDELGKLDGLVKGGAISWNIYLRGVKKVKNEFIDASKQLADAQDRFGGDNAAVTRGSTAAFNAIENSRSQFQRILSEEQQQTKLQQKANTLLGQLVRKAPPEPINVVETRL